MYTCNEYKTYTRFFSHPRVYMASSKAIQTSIVHVALGITIGTIIEAVLPDVASSASVSMQALEAAVQVALNGVMLASVGAILTDDDPTFGIPFSLALFEAQPGLLKRLAVLSRTARSQVDQVGQRMAPLVAGAGTPTRDSTP